MNSELDNVLFFHKDYVINKLFKEFNKVRSFKLRGLDVATKRQILAISIIGY